MILHLITLCNLQSGNYGLEVNMKRNNIISVIAFLLLCLIVAGSLAGCGAEAGNGEQPAGENDVTLSADEAYQSAISAEEGEECTSDECTVNLYDDDGECPYNVMSPIGIVSGQ